MIEPLIAEVLLLPHFGLRAGTSAVVLLWWFLEVWESLEDRWEQVNTTHKLFVWLTSPQAKWNFNCASTVTLSWECCLDSCCSLAHLAYWSFCFSPVLCCDCHFKFALILKKKRNLSDSPCVSTTGNSFSLLEFRTCCTPVTPSARWRTAPTGTTNCLIWTKDSLQSNEAAKY